MDCNVTHTSTSGPPASLTVESLRAMMATMPDFATVARCSPAAYRALKHRLSPAIGEVPPLMPGFFLHGLLCELDFELTGYCVEIDYRSGKVEKLDLSRKAVQNGQ